MLKPLCSQAKGNNSIENAFKNKTCKNNESIKKNPRNFYFLLYLQWDFFQLFSNHIFVEGQDL